MRILVVTAFPKLFEGPFEESIIKRAREKGLVKIEILDLRDFTLDKHKQVDDYPYGGGPGMILKPEPIFKAVEYAKTQEGVSNPRTILMTPQGQTYSQKRAKELSNEKELLFICGHYKGIDERVCEQLVDEEISVGDYILTGGELAAMVVVDSIIRLLPGVLGDLDSANSDSFEQGVLDCPYYTRPQEFQGLSVPEVLLSGNHAEIEKWRREQALKRTQKRRSDLFKQIESSNKGGDPNEQG